jgi:hypothetical protein
VKKWDMLNPTELATPTEAFLIVADADGRNAKTIASDGADQVSQSIWGAIDWR